MSLLKKISDDMKAAMKKRDKLRVSALRMLISQIQNINKLSAIELTPEQELAEVIKAAKKRRESIEIYQKSDRTDLLEKEQLELKIISEYLPEQMSDKDINKVISDVVERLSATSMKDMGRVMAESMKELKGKADGKKVQQLVSSKLA